MFYAKAQNEIDTIDRLRKVFDDELKASRKLVETFAQETIGVGSGLEQDVGEWSNFSQSRSTTLTCAKTIWCRGVCSCMHLRVRCPVLAVFVLQLDRGFPFLSLFFSSHSFSQLFLLSLFFLFCSAHFSNFISVSFFLCLLSSIFWCPSRLFLLDFLFLFLFFSVLCLFLLLVSFVPFFSSRCLFFFLVVPFLFFSAL